MISEERIKRLNSNDVKDRRFVLYWMQSSPRIDANLALEYAILKANKLNKPLLVFFGVVRDFPEANKRHYYFLLEGLREVEVCLQEIGVKLIVLNKSPAAAVVELSKDSCFTVVDKSYLKTPRQWYQYAGLHIDCPLVQVEDNVVVPVENASLKEEYTAATMRTKIEKKRPMFLTLPSQTKPKRDSLSLNIDSLNLNDIDALISVLDVDKSVNRTNYFKGGTFEALRRLDHFVKENLTNYAELKSDPTLNVLSDLSPYLHFGQISSLRIALRVLSTDTPIALKEAFLEELIVRRELAINYVHYDSNYDSIAGLPNWAKATLTAHQADPRPYLYTLEELENAQTHDTYWNASQNEMRLTGKMHGYMRMYWGKKIIEWTKTPEVAFKTALYLNNKYELDGRDPNGFAGVAWCFGKHDRPWKNRPIFGSVRFMNNKGLRRKFDADKYVKKVKNLN